jgi:hypothetical protein
LFLTESRKGKKEQREKSDDYKLISHCIPEYNLDHQSQYQAHM